MRGINVHANCSAHAVRRQHGVCAMCGACGMITCPAPPPCCTARTFEVTFFSATSTTPSFASNPIAAPAFEMASMAYSTWYNRPSGLKIVVRESYRRDMLPGCAKL